MDDEISSSFANELRAMARGTIDAQLTEVQQEVTKAVLETNKVGTFSIEFKVAMEPGMDSHVKLTPTIKSKPPKFDSPSQPFYTNTQGELSRDDPEAPKFDFREVNRDREAG